MLSIYVRAYNIENRNAVNYFAARVSKTADALRLYVVSKQRDDNPHGDYARMSNFFRRPK